MRCLKFVYAPDQEFVEVAQVHDEPQLGSITLWYEECWAGPWSGLRGFLYAATILGETELAESRILQEEQKTNMAPF